MPEEPRRTLRYVTAGAAAEANVVWAKSLIVCVTTLALSLPILAQYPLPTMTHRSLVLFLVVTGMFITAMLAAVKVEFNTKPLIFALTDVPQVICLVMLHPWIALSARMLAAAFIWFFRQRSLDRTLYNFGLFWLEIALSYAVYDSIQTPYAISWMPGLNPRWIVAAITCSVVGTVIAIIAIMYCSWQEGSWHNPLRWNLHQPQLVIGALGTVAGVAATASLQDSLWSAPGVLLSMGAIAWLIRGEHVNRQRIAILNEFRADTEHADRTEDDVLQALLKRSCHLMAGDYTTITVYDGTPHLCDGVLNRDLRHHISGGMTRTEHVSLVADERCLLYAVLVCDERTYAVLRISKQWADLGSYTKSHLRILAPLIGHAESEWRQTRLLEAIRHDATHDAVTGLGNVAYLQEVLQQRVDEGILAQVRCVDLRKITTGFGVELTTEVLEELADRLRSYTAQRGGAEVARVGDETFAIWLPLGHESELPTICTMLAAPIRRGRISISTSHAMGYSLIGIEESPALAIRQAHTAMASAAARRSRLPVQFHERDIHETRNRVALTEDLRNALAASTLQVQYQPKIDAATGRPTSVEALVRWPHPERGDIAPMDFIPLAASSGDMAALTGLVIDRAVGDCATWQVSSPGCGVSINVATSDLEDPAFVDQVLNALSRHGLWPNLLTIELTETAMMQNRSAAVETLERLRSAGISVSVDDFGTGYSSLSYLRSLPIDEAKIDQAFVRTLDGDPTGKDLVKHIIALMHSLGIRVVAEGVESSETWAYLRDVECDVLQGFSIARPMGVIELSRWMSAYCAPSAMSNMSTKRP